MANFRIKQQLIKLIDNYLYDYHVWDYDEAMETEPNFIYDSVTNYLDVVIDAFNGYLEDAYDEQEENKINEILTLIAAMQEG